GDTVCIEGVCRNPCGNSEFTCAVGLLCKYSSIFDASFCVPGACALCKSTERCENDVCVDPCASVTCEDNLICVRGECRDCTVAGCPRGQVCYQSMCQVDACLTQQCGEGEFCTDGRCVPLCDDSTCAIGERCNDEGACAADSCADVTCGNGEACRAGRCEANPCLTIPCPVGQACVPSLGCITDGCAVTTCPEGTICSLSAQGTPRCSVPGSGVKQPPKYVSTGGAGLTSCSVGVLGSSAGNAGGWLGWWCAAWWLARSLRRRSSRTRAGLPEPARMLLTGATLVVVSTLLVGCETTAICLDCQASGRGAGGDGARAGSGGGGLIDPLDDGGQSDDDGGGGNGGVIPPETCTYLGDEVCNSLDDDCDGRTDEDFDFRSNVRHCGGCDRPCQADNALTACEVGECKVQDCLPGFADSDGELGCEYRCPVYPPSPEDCNGIDDDCDGRADEEIGERDGDRLCRHTEGTPCEGVKLVCATRENKTTWFCDYPAIVDFDPAVPDGIRSEELRCDGEDNDCDGVADEPWPELGEPCDDGKVGACRDGGEMACTSDHKGTSCDLSRGPSPVPGAGPDAAELCNDLDDNCDGIVDNSDPTDPKHIVDDMVELTRSGTKFWIYRYEASRPDAKADSAGITPARACSNKSVVPWHSVSYTAASAACIAAGKRLCKPEEWQFACDGDANTNAAPPGRTYPYGDAYSADSCNGTDHDVVAGGVINNAVLPTGAIAACVTPESVFDLSGNLKEWVDQMGTGVNNHVIRGGSYESPRLGLTCQTTLSQATDTSVLPGLGFRCCSDVAPSTVLPPAP
ncbi:MAG: MopE-related protein, partial [Polyangiales bacterium]